MKALRKHYRQICYGKPLVDITFQYDVPPEKFTEVAQVINSMLSAIRLSEINASQLINHLELYYMRILLPEFKEEATRLEKELIAKEQVKIKVTTSSIFKQFKSPFEGTTYIMLKTMESRNFKIHKYQAQLEEYFANTPRWQKFAMNNPDLILMNDFMGLLECKSEDEWGTTFHLNKRVLTEITCYNLFCEEVKKLKLKRRCVVVFSYEGQIRADDIAGIEHLLAKDFPNVVIVTERSLKKALIDVSLKNRMKEILSVSKIRQHII